MLNCVAVRLCEEKKPRGKKKEEVDLKSKNIQMNMQRHK